MAEPGAIDQTDNPFAHLIPKPQAPEPENPFKKLIPAENQPKANAFLHLIPKQNQAAGEVQEPPQKPKRMDKSFWDSTKGLFVDFYGQVKQGYGDKNPWELMKAESLPAHLVQGIERVAGKEPPLAQNDPSDPSMLDSLKALGVTAIEHPGILIGSLVRSLVADPELLLPWLWEAIPEATAAKVAMAARAMGAEPGIVQVMSKAGFVAGRAGTAAVANAAIEGGEQFAKGQGDAGKVAGAAAEGAVLGAFGKTGGKVKEPPLLRDRTLPVVHETVGPSLPPMVSPESETYALWKAVGENPHEAAARYAADMPKGLTGPTKAVSNLVNTLRQAAIGGTVGASVGYAFHKKYGKEGKDDEFPWGSVIAGATLGAGVPLLKSIKYKGEDISEAVNARLGQEEVVKKYIYQFQKTIEDLVPDKGRREAISEMIDRGVEPSRMIDFKPPRTEHMDPRTKDTFRTVNPGEMSNEYKAYAALKEFFAHMHAVASEAEVIDGWRDNYIAHMVVESKAKGSFLAELFKGEVEGGRPSGKDRNKQRRYETFEELNAAIKDSGLELKTKDAAQIAGDYASSVYKSIADKRLLKALEAMHGADGTPLVMQMSKLVPKINKATGKAEVISVQNRGVPSSYKTTNNRQLAPYRVHPDIVGDLGFVFSNHNPGWLRARAETLTQAAKRAVVFSSLFHAKTLFEGFITQNMSDPMNPKLLSPKSAIEVYRRGGGNDGLDTLLKNGLKIRAPEDVERTVQARGIDRVGDMLNASLPLKGLGVGAIAKGLAKIDRANEHITFGHLQMGFKISTALTEYAKQIEMGVEKNRAAKNAASFANDLYGSLDFYRVATDTTSYVFRKIGTSTLNINSRKLLQLFMFAPDWTMATFRTAAKAMPGGVDDKLLGQIHRRYMLKSAIYYLGFMNLANYMNTGHSIFSNANPLRIDIGNNQTIQASKHETEPFAWLQDPVGTLINKGSFGIHMIAEHHRESSYAEFLHRPPPTLLDDAWATAKAELPIPLQEVPIAVHEFIQNGITKEALLRTAIGVGGGELGFPVYGKTPAQKAQEKAERTHELQEERRKKNEAAP